MRRCSARRSRLGVGEQASLRLPEALFEEVSPLAQACSADFEIATSTTEHGGAGIEARTQLVLVPRRFGLSRLPRLELGHDRLQLGDAAPFGGHNLGELVTASCQRLVLDDDLTAL